MLLQIMLTVVDMHKKLVAFHQMYDGERAGLIVLVTVADRSHMCHHLHLK